MVTTPVRPFRFGVVLIATGCSRQEWVTKCRRAEDLGYDVIAAPDHIDLPSPFPSVVLAAEVTERPRIGVYVVNTGLHNPALLARDIATTDRFLDGRLEIGLGTGYVAADFARTGVPIGRPGDRVDKLERTIIELEQHLGWPDNRLVQSPRPPMLVGGHGDRVLGLAAEHASIVSFVGARLRPEHGRMCVVDAATLRERVEFVRAAAGPRADQLELNVLTKATLLTGDRRAGARELLKYGPGLSVDQLLELPTMLIGTAGDIAGQLLGHREDFGISYFTVLEAAMENFGRVIARL